MKYQAELLGVLYVLFTIILTTSTQSERDIILTPKLALQVKGKTLYYKPVDYPESNGTTSQIPWEQTLKHVTYLTINNHNIEKSTNLSGIPEYKTFLKSPYIQSNEYIPKFGDIITLASGRLEKIKNDEYRFVEGKCTNQCDEEQHKLIAYWMVQKVRHRDADRKFRYEIKFSVSPNVSDKSDSKREIGKRKIRAFILKDDDYPKNFVYLDQHVADRRYDEHISYSQRLGEINHIFSKPRYFHNSQRVHEQYNNAFPELNLGEYIHDTSMSSRNSASSNKLIFPTTYRPQYHVKFSKPNFVHSPTNYPQYSVNNYEENNLMSPLPTTHLHHHYYMTKAQGTESTPILHVHKQSIEFPYIKDHRGAIDIIEEPLRSSSNPISKPHNYHTPSPISNQIPIPPNMSTHIQITQTPYSIPITNPIIPPPPVIYMQSIPISHHVPVYVYPRHNTQHNNYVQPTKAFAESPKDEGMRYSEPDPLYHNVNINFENTLPTQIDQQSVEITSPSGIENEDIPSKYSVYQKQLEKLPDSINDQLPPPENDEDLSVPYVETSIVTQTSATTSRLVAPKSNSVESSSSESILATDIQNTFVESTKKTWSQNPEILSKPLEYIKESSNLSNIRNDQNISNQEQISQGELNYSESIKENYPLNKPPTVGTLNTKSFSTKSRAYTRVTTEQPVLKWKPKRTKLNKVTSTTFSSARDKKLNEFTSSKFKFEAIPVNVTQRIITVTPPNNDDVQTKQSVSTSISIKVGTEEEERPFIPTISVPNVELYRAKLESVGTNSSNIKLYMARDQKRVKDKKEEMELAKTIVQHVQSLR